MSDHEVLPLSEAVAQIREKGEQLTEAAVNHWDAPHMERAVSDWEWALGALYRTLGIAE